MDFLRVEYLKGASRGGWMFIYIVLVADLAGAKDYDEHCWYPYVEIIKAAC